MSKKQIRLKEETNIKILLKKKMPLPSEGRVLPSTMKDCARMGSERKTCIRMHPDRQTEFDINF